MDGKSLKGYVTLVQGVGSISRDFAKEVGGTWIMLVDREYVQTQQGGLDAIAKLKPIDQRYVVANNKWFKEEEIVLAKQLFQPNNSDASHVYVNQGKVVIDLPALDENKKVFGRQLFIQDQAVYLKPLQDAEFQAWMTLVAVVGAILILTLILLVVIRRQVILPLAQLNETVMQIFNSADFSIRSQLKSKDEVGETAQTINQLLNQMGDAIEQANHTVQALSEGVLDQRIGGEFSGDLAILKTSINQSVDNVALMIQEIAHAMQQMKNGQFSLMLIKDKARALLPAS